jgi:hypothetical protein
MWIQTHGWTLDLCFRCSHWFPCQSKGTQRNWQSETNLFALKNGTATAETFWSCNHLGLFAPLVRVCFGDKWQSSTCN